MSVKRRMMLLALGCEVVLTPKETAVPGALAKAHEIMKTIGPDTYMLQQFEITANPKAHRETTGPEIWRDTDGLIDILISGVSTGGTISGISQYIKGKAGCQPLKPSLKTVAVETREQMLITEVKGGKKLEPQGPHKIQGMGSGLVPKVLDLKLVDEVIPIHSDEAMAMAHELWMIGLPVGNSAGSIVAASIKELAKPESAHKIAAAIIPSFGERYFAHPTFADTDSKAEAHAKQPLPEPYDNSAYVFAAPRG